MKEFIAVCLLLICLNPASAAESVIKKVSGEGLALMLNPLPATKARPYEAGFKRDGDVYVCDNDTDASARRGVSWLLQR